MIEYIVNYEIPKSIQTNPETVQGSLQIVISEGRANEYKEVYDRLDKIGTHLMTSSYRVQYDGNADALREYILQGLDEQVAGKIILFIYELTNNHSSYDHGVRS